MAITLLEIAVDRERKRVAPAGKVERTMRFPEDLYDRLEAIATKAGLPFNGVVVSCLRVIIESEDAK